jgi:Fur family peroxide stress response transcriptional regulator
MKNDNDIEQRIQYLIHCLREAGVKATNQRLEVFRTVLESEEHPDAERVYQIVSQRVPTISLDTVYRTLWLLKDLDFISTIETTQSKTRFDANIDTHHHFVCSECGAIIDFYNDKFDKLEIPIEIEELGTANRLLVEIKGICNKCSANMTNDQIKTKKGERK